METAPLSFIAREANEICPKIKILHGYEFLSCRFPGEFPWRIPCFERVLNSNESGTKIFL